MTTPDSTPQPLALVVDDDPTVRLLMRQVLHQAGLEVEEAGDGLDALAQFKRRIPDIVLLDVMMPKMDGFETCHAIRHLPGGSHTPILIMTGLNDVDSIEKAYEMGATDFIAKPWQVLVLSYRIRYMLRTARVLNALRESQAHLARAQRVARLGTWTWTMPADQLTASDEMYRLLDLSRGAFPRRWQEYLACIHPDDHAAVQQHVEAAWTSSEGSSIEYRICRANGSERMVTEHVESLVDDTGLTYAVIGTVQDITDRRSVESRLFHSTHYDVLTGLPNQQLFKDRLEQVLLDAQGTTSVGALILVDLDQFRHINEVHGMSSGDALLKLAADRLLTCVRKDDLLSPEGPSLPNTEVAKLIGDTFALCLPNLPSDRDAAKVARRVLASIRRPFHLNDQRFLLTASAGIALWPQDGHVADTLMNHAATALQTAKNKGGDRFDAFVKDMTEAVADRQQLEQDFRRALEQHELTLHYQPQVNVKRWSITAVEAFVRWRHPTRGLIPPDQFIPLAEQAGLGVALGEWIIRAVCAQQKAWQLAGGPAIRVSVNLSDYHVRQQSLVEIISLAVQDIGPTPDYFEVELSEGALMHDLAHSIKLLKRLKSLGIRIAVDNFGAGSSSIRALAQLPLDTVKIAPDFVEMPEHPAQSGGITAAIIGLGHGLHCRVVAKKVETQAQLEALRVTDCDDIQGHLYGAAEPPEHILHLLTNRPTGPGKQAA